MGYKDLLTPLFVDWVVVPQPSYRLLDALDIGRTKVVQQSAFDSIDHRRYRQCGKKNIPKEANDDWCRRAGKDFPSLIPGMTLAPRYATVGRDVERSGPSGVGARPHDQ